MMSSMDGVLRLAHKEILKLIKFEVFCLALSTVVVKIIPMYLRFVIPAGSRATSRKIYSATGRFPHDSPIFLSCAAYKLCLYL